MTKHAPIQAERLNHDAATAKAPVGAPSASGISSGRLKNGSVWSDACVWQRVGNERFWLRPAAAAAAAATAEQQHNSNRS